MGISEDARLIKKHTLDIDFTLTGMNFQLDSGTGITGDKPGVIRVYQEGYAESAAIFSVTGTYYSTAAFNVDIKGDLGARIVVIDA
jgi:hypothetical protein